MTRKWIGLGLGVLLLAAGSWLAFSIQKHPAAGDVAAIEPAAPPLGEPAAPLGSPAAPPAALAGTAPAPAPGVPLERLLELPAAPSAKPKLTVGPVLRSQEGSERPSARVKVEAAATVDRPTVRPDRAAERLDVGVSVGVDETTRLRGGVRVESGTDETREPSRTPVLGIEKRF